MSLQLYKDVHIPRAVTNGLRLRGVDVLTAQEDGSARLDDGALLTRATALGRVLVSQDADLLREGTRRRREKREFFGIIYANRAATASARWWKISLCSCKRHLPKNGGAESNIFRFAEGTFRREPRPVGMVQKAD